MYGHRARIGYTSPPLTTEVFPYEFYKIVPDGVTLVITTLAIVDRSKGEVDQSYDISMKAAREMAAAGVDIVVLGGVPINLSRGYENAEQMIIDLEAELGVKVSTSASAQAKAAKALGCRKVVVAQPYEKTRPTGSPAMAPISAARCSARPAGAAPSTRSDASRETPRSRWAASSCANIPMPTRCCCRRRTGRWSAPSTPLEEEFGVTVMSAPDHRLGRAAPHRRRRPHRRASAACFASFEVSP